MTADTETISIRLPNDMVGKIDGYIQSIGHFTSRPSYIVNSMAVLFRTLVDSRLKIDAEIDGIRKTIDLDPNILLSITQTMVRGYMEKYERYEGEPVQILLRVPVGLLNAIDEYAPVLGLYSKRIDFIRMAVVNQLALDESFLEKLDQVKEHRVQQKRSTDEIIHSVLSNLTKDSVGVNGMLSLVDSILKETRKAD